VRKLLSCPSCHRQLDATRFAAGSRFRCRCGVAIDVPEIAPRDAAVVRCASCGAAREEGAKACGYCGSDFTIHEQDLETICPSCLARISNTARFCHHCSTAIAPEEIAADPTDRVCPACGDGRCLNSRALGSTRLTVLECGVCAGLWLGTDVFRTLEDRARKVAVPAPDTMALQAEVKARPTPHRGPAYRPCPTCKKRMNRLNFERVSGIIIDRCRDHGIWFDASELDAALRFIKLGGERVSDARQQEEDRARASQLRFKVEPKIPQDGRRVEFFASEGEDRSDAVSVIVHWLLKR
jgi:Zn-finger nucleic acid-binding protein